MLVAGAILAAPTPRPLMSEKAAPSFQQPLVDLLPGSPIRLTEAHLAATRGDARAQWHNAARMERRSRASLPRDEERDDPPPDDPPVDPAADATPPAADAPPAADDPPAADAGGEGEEEKAKDSDPIQELASTAGTTMASLWMARNPWAVLPMVWGGMWYPMTGFDPLGSAPPVTDSSVTDD